MSSFYCGFGAECGPDVSLHQNRIVALICGEKLLVRKKIGRGYGGWSDKRVNGRSFKVLGWGIDEWLIAQRIFEVEGYKTRIRRSPPQSYNGVDVGSKLRLWVND